jgi:hypothetical protein
VEKSCQIGRSGNNSLLQAQEIEISRLKNDVLSKEMLITKLAKELQVRYQG